MKLGKCSEQKAVFTPRSITMEKIVIFVAATVLSAATAHAGAYPLFSLPVGSADSCLPGVTPPTVSAGTKSVLDRFRKMIDTRAFDGEEFRGISIGLATMGEEVVIPLVKLGQEKQLDFYIPFAEAPGPCHIGRKYQYHVMTVLRSVRDPKAAPLLKQLLPPLCEFRQSALEALLAMNAEFTPQELETVLQEHVQPQQLFRLVQVTRKKLDNNADTKFLLSIMRQRIDRDRGVEHGSNLHSLDEEERKVLFLIIQELGGTKTPEARKYLLKLRESYRRTLQVDKEIASSGKIKTYSDVGQERIRFGIDILTRLVSVIETALAKQGKQVP